MASNLTKRIFLSYARGDGEEFARTLRTRLEAEGLSLWQDRTDMEGGRDWWNQIDEALRHVEYMVVVMTPRAARSDVVSKEWRLARQRGVGVVPVMGAAALDFGQLPRWMRETHFVDITVEDQWKRMVRQLESPCVTHRVPFMAPDLPADFVERPREYGEVIGALLNREAPVAITAALKGAGGYGKTTLAMRLCHDDRVQEEFHDGVLWVTLGEKPGDVTSKVIDLIETLSGERPGFADADAAAARLSELLADNDLLMVIDDVWNAADVRPLLRGGSRCVRLITTRNSETLPDGCLRTDLDGMQSREAVRLLGWKLPESPRHGPLAARLGEWPLLLKVVNGTLRKRMGAGEPFEAALDYVERVLDRRGLTGFDERNTAQRNRAAAVTLGVSIDQLSSQERARFRELAVFPEDTGVPLGVIERLWRATANLDELDSEDLCRRLFDFSLLLRLDLAAREVRMHDVVRTILREQSAKELATWHARLLDSHGGTAWWEMDAADGYLWRHLPYHLSESGRPEELANLLFDYRWLEAKLRVAGLNALLDDYESLPQKTAAMEAVAHAIRLSAHVLSEDRRQLPSQLTGRLADLTEHPGVVRLCDSTDRWAAKPWIRARFPDLERPGGALLRTYSGHPDKVIALAVSADGRRAVAACWDALTVWDLEGEQWAATFETSPDISAVATTSDGRLAITGHWDGVLRVWDLQAGQQLRTLPGHPGGVNAIAMLDDSRIVSGSDDETLIVWNIETGLREASLAGHRGSVTALAVTCDGRTLVSASKDDKLRIWDIGRRKLQRALGGHQGISALALGPDGCRAVTGSWNGTLVIWDLERGEALQKLAPLSERTNFDKINSIAITPNGRRFISASDDKALRLWDLTSGRELRPFAGHSDRVSAVALLPGGMCALSASWDRTVKLWDLDSVFGNRTLTGHSDRVNALAVTPDGKRAFTAGKDGMLRLWNVGSGGEACSFACDENVHHVAVTADGRRAMSVSDTGELRLWDLEGGAPLPAAVSFSSNTDANKIVVGESGFRVIHTSEAGATSWDPESGQRGKDYGRGFHPVTVTADGRHAISLKPSNLIQRFDADSGALLGTYTNEDYRVYGVGATPGGLRALASGQDKLKVIDVETAQVLRSWANDDRWSVIALSSDGRLIIRTPYWSEPEVLDVLTGAVRPMHVARKMKTLSITGDGHRVMGGDDLGAVMLWDVSAGGAVRRILGKHPQSVTAVAISADGARGISGSRDGTVKIWDFGANAEMESSSDFLTIAAVAITPDGKRVAVLDGSLTIWDAGQEEGFHRSFLGHWAESSVCLTSDGNEVITAASQGHVPTLWDVDAGTAICHLPRGFPWETPITVTADGRRAISISERVQLWDLQNGEELTSFAWDVSTAAAATPDGSRVVMVSRDGKLCIWRSENAVCEAVFTADAPFVKCAIAHDGRIIVAGDIMGRIHFLNVME